MKKLMMARMQHTPLARPGSGHHALELPLILVSLCGCSGSVGKESPLTQPESAPSPSITRGNGVVPGGGAGGQSAGPSAGDGPIGGEAAPASLPSTLPAGAGGTSAELTCSDAEVIPPDIYVRRVKNLLTGMAVTAEELQAVQTDPSVLSELIGQWQGTAAYEHKLGEWLRTTLQLTPDIKDVSRQISNTEGINANGLVEAELYANVLDSFARTALRIATNDVPWTEIVQTPDWEMTTALMAFLSAIDDTPSEEYSFYSNPVTVDGQPLDENTPLAVQAELRTFHVTMDSGGECASQPFALNDAEARQSQSTRIMRGFKSLSGISSGGSFCNIRTTRPIEAEDYNDWRTVRIVPEDRETLAHFSDVGTLRTLTELPLRTPRRGFFGSPAFLASWTTNVDNDFRVIINQTLIVALDAQFDPEDLSLPLSDDGLAKEHADPTTVCYGCHATLDPMRNYFKNAFAEPYYTGPPTQGHQTQAATFSFRGFSGGNGSNENFEQLGAHLANHPLFASAWTQKLCLLANSERCSVTDPEFERVVAAFRDSGYRFSTLVRELFSSPLITRASCGNAGQPFAKPTIVRRRHLCSALSERLGVDVCGERTTQDLTQAIPTDEWARGRETPDQTTVPSLTLEATLDAACQEFASDAVDQSGTPLDSSDMDGSLEFLVTGLMGVPTSDPLYPPLLARLQQLNSDAEATGANARERLQSAFVVACRSPFLSSVDL